MPTRVWPQPMLVVRDVARARDFYTAVLGAESGHGGDEYEQIVVGGEILLQLHRIDVEDHHGLLAADDVPLGNGFLLWFEIADFDAAVARARSHGAEVERDVHVNPNAKQRELWLRDPDGYRVVLAGPSEYRPRDG
jgi:catechol 2,3-dioxygenase-like lactoylglutathione lyase family enzyme